MLENLKEELPLRHAVWLQAEPVQRLLGLLGASEARVVGGCVRDALRGEQVGDIDIATTHKPKDVLTLLAGEKIKTTKVGLAHGTVRAILDKQMFEITSLRRDVKTDGRRAEVQFGGTWDSDAARRDFTFNALYASADGKLFDPLGEGVADLRRARVRFIGDAKRRIREDYLRILRFFRMHYLLRASAPPKQELEACRAQTKGLAHVSPERVHDELRKILRLENFVPALRAMERAGVLERLTGKKNLPRWNFARAAALGVIETEHFFQPNDLLRLAALLPHKESAAALAQAWRFSKADALYLDEALSLGDAMLPYLSTREVRRMLYRIGADTFRARVFLTWAEDKRPQNGIAWRALLAMADGWERPRLPLTGQMMMAAGVPQGPQMRRVQKEVERWWIDSDFISDEFSIIERLKAIVQATIY